MEYVLEQLYVGFAIVLFILAVTFLITMFRTLSLIELEAKKQVYTQHVIYQEN